MRGSVAMSYQKVSVEFILDRVVCLNGRVDSCSWTRCRIINAKYWWLKLHIGPQWLWIRELGYKISGCFRKGRASEGHFSLLALRLETARGKVVRWPLGIPWWPRCTLAFQVRHLDYTETDGPTIAFCGSIWAADWPSSNGKKPGGY